MENSEEVLHILERYSKQKPKDIPKELEEYLCYVAKTGDTVFRWTHIKLLFREKFLNAIKAFHEASPSIQDIPQYPNVDPFNYENMKTVLLDRIELFNAAPFTIQRLCELLTDPKKQYNRIDKYMRALEKNILVVSTLEPGRKTAESENGDSLDSVANGDLSLDINVEVDMERDSEFKDEIICSANVDKPEESSSNVENTKTIQENECHKETDRTPQDSLEAEVFSETNKNSINDAEPDADENSMDILNKRHKTEAIDDKTPQIDLPDEKLDSVTQEKDSELAEPHPQDQSQLESDSVDTQSGELVDNAEIHEEEHHITKNLVTIKETTSSSSSPSQTHSQEPLTITYTHTKEASNENEMPTNENENPTESPEFVQASESDKVDVEEDGTKFKKKQEEMTIEEITPLPETNQEHSINSLPVVSSSITPQIVNDQPMDEHNENSQQAESTYSMSESTMQSETEATSEVDNNKAEAVIMDIEMSQEEAMDQ